MLDIPPLESRYHIDICEDKDEWNTFIERQDGPVFAHWGWAKAVETYGHDYWQLVARQRETGDIVALLPLYHVENRLFGSQLLSPAFGERGSIVVNDKDSSWEAARALLEQTKHIAEKLDVDFASLRGSRISGTDDFVTRHRYVTFQVSVDEGEKAIWSGIKDSRQRQIEQAADNPALQFRVGDSLADLREYYRLYLRTMRGHGSPPHSFQFFRTLWERLHEAGHLRLSMITENGSLINGMIDLSLGSTVYQWGVVSDYERRNLNGGSLLHWKSLEWAAENGYETYEFGRTREGSGVYLFKKSFGGSKEWYDDLHYFPNESAEPPDPNDAQYDLARTMWRRLPLPVIRIIGPQIRKRIGI